MIGVVALLLALASGVIELRVQVSAPVAGLRSGDAGARVAVLRTTRRPGTMRRERRPELGPHQLILVTFDRDGRQLDWRSMPDPRIFRAETADLNGFLSGEVFTLDTSEFSVRIPDVPGATSLKIYATEPNDSGFGLAMVGVVELAR